MITISGQRIEPKGKYNDWYLAAPGLGDIAYGLFRMTRFAGHSRQWWSVLYHSLAVESYLAMTKATKLQRLYGLLHDAHEAVVSDVSTGWKTDQARLYEKELDERLYTYLGLQYPISVVDERAVKHADSKILEAEGTILGPPGIMAFLHPAEDTALFAVQQVYDLVSKDDPRDPAFAISIREFHEQSNFLLSTWQEEVQ